MRNKRSYSQLAIEQAASGLSVADFCRRRGLNTGSMYKHTTALKKQQNLKNMNESYFIPIQIPTNQSSKIRIDGNDGLSLVMPIEVVISHPQVVTSILSGRCHEKLR
ncbi:MAG: hypothetical protein AB8C84_04240 [Oligoflexales bacterium]